MVSVPLVFSPSRARRAPVWHTRAPPRSCAVLVHTRHAVPLLLGDDNVALLRCVGFASLSGHEPPGHMVERKVGLPVSSALRVQ